MVPQNVFAYKSGMCWELIHLGDITYRGRFECNNKNYLIIGNKGMKKQIRNSFEQIYDY